jgi:hypothetical protein
MRPRCSDAALALASAVIGADTIPLEPGSTMFVAQGTTHGLYATSDTVEYLLVHGPQASAAGFRRRAARPGPQCPTSRASPSGISR